MDGGQADDMQRAHEDEAERRRRRSAKRRRRIVFSVAGLLIGAIALAIVGLFVDVDGSGLVRLAVMGSGVGLLLGLTLVGAVEDGEEQRETERRMEEGGGA